MKDKPKKIAGIEKMGQRKAVNMSNKLKPSNYNGQDTTPRPKNKYYNGGR